MIADILQDLQGDDLTRNVTGERTRSRLNTPSLRKASDKSYRNTRERDSSHRQEMASMSHMNHSGYFEGNAVLQIEHRDDSDECYEVEYSQIGEFQDELERIESNGTECTERTGNTTKYSSDELEDFSKNPRKMTTIAMQNELEYIDEEAGNIERSSKLKTNPRQGGHSSTGAPAAIRSILKQPGKKEKTKQNDSEPDLPKGGGACQFSENSSSVGQTKSREISGNKKKTKQNNSEPDLSKGRGASRFSSSVDQTKSREIRYQKMNRQDPITEREISCFESKRTKRIAILLLMYALAASAACSWLVHQFLRIPGLTNEIDDLKVQVNRLTGEIDRFGGEVSRLEGEVEELESINDNLEITVTTISEENERTKVLVIQFNETVLEYKEQNSILTEENQRYEEYTDTLNQTVQNLSTELAEVQKSEASLTAAVEGYAEVQENLEQEIIELTSHANELNITVDNLNEALIVFQEENKQFRELNEDLGEIVSFLEEEAEGVEESYAALASHLADTILRKQVLAEIGLHERMKTERAGWQCGYKTAFSSQEFVKDEEVSIGYSSYDTVLGYISDSFFDDLCISRGNFETFLRYEVLSGGQRLWEITSKDLAAGVNMYTTQVLEYYFPDSGEEGLTRTAWDEADYDCNNIPPEERYFYTVSRKV